MRPARGLPPAHDSKAAPAALETYDFNAALSTYDMPPQRHRSVNSPRAISSFMISLVPP